MGNKNHVIHTSPSLAPEGGGTSRAVLGLCTAISDQGWDINILTTHKKKQPYLLTLNNSDSVNTTILPCRWGLGKWQLAPDFGEILATLTLKTNQPTIIHTNGIWLPVNSISTQVAQRTNTPLIISPHGMLEPWSMGYKSWRKQIAWNAYQRRDLTSAALIHATAEAERKNIRRLGFSQPITIVPNGVTIPTVQATHGQNAKPDRLRTILFLSRIHPKKGLLNLVNAIAHTQLSGWQINIVGPSELGHKEEVKQAAQKVGVSALFNFVGSVNDQEKWAYYQQSDLFVLPTYSENFGIVIAEALATGIPVITTTGTPWAELKSHRCGWWIPPGVKPLTKALLEATRLNDSERARMGERGRELIKNYYSWEHVAEMMLTTYQFVLGQSTITPSYIDC